MREFIVQKGNNMPVQSPLVPDPVIPYTCKESKTVFVICQGDEKVIKEFLGPTPFEYVNDLCMIYINDFSTSNELPYMDAGIIFQVKYKDILGGYYMFEYEDDDAAIATGRELWGYPKKYGSMNLVQEGQLITGTATKKGVEIIRVEVDLSKPLKDLTRLKIFPHLNIHTIPKPDGPGIFSKRIIARDNSSDCQLLSEELGAAKVELNSTPTDPLGEFKPVKIMGGGYTVVDFVAGEVNGWGKVIDTLI